MLGILKIQTGGTADIDLKKMGVYWGNHIQQYFLTLELTQIRF